MSQKVDKSEIQNQKNIEKAKNAYAYYVNKIKTVQDALNRDFLQLTLDDLNDKMFTLQRLIKSYEEKCIELTALVEIEASEAEANDSRNEALISFILRRIAVLEKQEKDTQTQEEQAPDTKPTQASPQIQNTWGKFDGSQASWPTFKDAFCTSVLESTIEDMQKYELLKQACQVPEILALITSSKDNIQTAWKKLNDFYGDKYAQLETSMQTIKATKPITVPTAKSLRGMLNKMTRSIQIIKGITNENKFDFLFVPAAVDKLDAETKRGWERHRLALAMSWSKENESQEKRDISNHLPEWSDFEKFMEDEIKVCAMQETRLAMQSNECTYNDRRNMPTTNQNPKIICGLCNENHKTHRCEAFLRLNFENRWKAIRQNSLCVKCFEAEHGQSLCEKNADCNAPCPRCFHNSSKYYYHNSTLCPIKFGHHPGTEGFVQQ